MPKPNLVKPVKFDQAKDELPLKLLQGSNVREALPWLEESHDPSRSLGEATGQAESIRLVEKLYRLSAIAVHAVEIDGEPTDDQNTEHRARSGFRSRAGQRTTIFVFDVGLMEIV